MVALFLCLVALPLASKFILIFSGIKVYFFRILIITEDHLRHLVTWIEPLLDSSTFYW